MLMQICSFIFIYKQVVFLSNCIYLKADFATDILRDLE